MRLFVQIRNTDPSLHVHSHFKAYAIPPIKYWNPNVEIAVEHDFEKAVEPLLTVEFSTFISSILPLDDLQPALLIRLIEY